MAAAWDRALLAGLADGCRTISGRPSASR